MPGDFFARIEELKEQVGEGLMTGTVVVDQVYAFNLEVGYWINFLGKHGFHTLFPRHGGMLLALAFSLAEQEQLLMEGLAEGLLKPDGLYAAMVDGMEGVSSRYATNAPIEWGNLRESGHPMVTDNGVPVYDRPPHVPRLSREELDALGRESEWREAARTETGDAE